MAAARVIALPWWSAAGVTWARPSWGPSWGLGAAIDTLAAAIQQQEGYYPGSAAYRNNNPGNLMYAGQAGATRGAGGLAVFPTYEDGLAALYAQINRYAGRGMTIADMTAVYAPAGIPGNDPAVYATNLAAALGVSPGAVLSDVLAASDPAAVFAPENVPAVDSSSFSNAFSDLPPAAIAGLTVGAGLLLLGLFSGGRS